MSVFDILSDVLSLLTVLRNYIKLQNKQKNIYSHDLLDKLFIVL